MGSTAANATIWNAPNYVGELFEINKKKTPLLSLIGGLAGGGKMVNSFEFPLGQHFSLDAGSQPAITEAASQTAPTAGTYARTQTVNTCQIFQRAVNVSYAKQSNANAITGLSLTGEVQPITNEKDFQIEQSLKQVALDVNWTFHNGVYQQATSAAVAPKSRGILTAITTNATAAAGAQLTKAMIDATLKMMADNGADMNDMYIFCNSYQKQKISSLYSYVPTDRSLGGSNIEQIITDFCRLNVVYDPHVPAASLGIYDLAPVVPVFCAVPDKGVLFYEDLAKTGATETGEIYGQIGLAYGHETLHGKITGLATA